MIAADILAASDSPGGALSIAAARTPTHPVTLARAVMEHTEHVLLVGDGADRLATHLELEQSPPSYFITAERAEQQRLAARQGNGRQSPLLRVKKDKPRDLLRLEEQLADHLTASVEIRVQRKGKRGEQGEVAIAFGSLEELNGLLEKLGLPAQ